MNDDEVDDLKAKGEFMAGINFYQAPDDPKWARYRHRDGNEQARTTRGGTGEAYALERKRKWEALGAAAPPNALPKQAFWKLVPEAVFVGKPVRPSRPHRRPAGDRAPPAPCSE